MLNGTHMGGEVMDKRLVIGMLLGGGLVAAAIYLAPEVERAYAELTDPSPVPRCDTEGLRDQMQQAAESAGLQLEVLGAARPWEGRPATETERYCIIDMRIWGREIEQAFVITLHEDGSWSTKGIMR